MALMAAKISSNINQYLYHGGSVSAIVVWRRSVSRDNNRRKRSESVMSGGENSGLKAI